ncbi:Dinitrogenase iron-molybdenum cofactor [Alteromonadaceae bacterium Bs31]|nr:Dinitrogenase iron-molybdenum cofactor [Alteromonadaceae bacterium Bs31]
MNENESIKIGVATKDGVSVNLHFGHADTFWVYELSERSFSFMEKREVEKYCHGHIDTSGVLAKILETIKDCKAVFSAKIGAKPAEKLESIGIQSVDDYAYEAIGESLLHFAQQQAL